MTRPADRAAQGCLALLGALGLGLLVAPLFLWWHRNEQERVVLERWQQ